MKHITHAGSTVLRGGSRTFRVCGLAVVAIGVVWVVFSLNPKADTPTTASVQAEAGTRLGNVTQVSDATASAGSAVQFGAVTGGGGTTCIVGQAPGSVDCPAPPAPTLSGKQWKVIFNDDFNGTSLDTSKWTPCFDWNYGDCTGTFNQGRERYYPSQVRLSSGTAKLVAEPMSPSVSNSGCYQSTCNYKAGLISTARPRADNGSNYLFPFTYGYVEGRMKYPAVSGMFTAFWMLPASTDFTYDTEIDIVEILGGMPKNIFMTYHYSDRGQSYTPNNGDASNGVCALKDYSKDWVRFGLDWEPTYIAWYIDGVKCGQFNGNTSTIENGPMQLILHMMVDNNWERSFGMTLPNLQTSATLEVDYVRIYQQQ